MLKAGIFAIFMVGCGLGMAAPLPQDPYKSALGPGDRAVYSAKIRVIQRGVPITGPDLAKQIEATNRIFSQCEGVDFRLEAVDTIAGSYTKDQDQLFAFDSAKMFLSSQFFSFFEPFRATKSPDIIDVHLVDYFSEAMRNPKNSSVQELHLGQAVIGRLVGWILHDPRPVQEPTAQEVGGDTVTLAWTLLKQQTGRLVKVLDKNKSKPKKGIYIYTHGVKAYNHSLLAHELGHILMETQTPTDGLYVDHYCAGTKDVCPSENLMSPGGYVDKVKVSAKDFKTPVAYTPMPSVQPEQCEALLQSPFVNRLN